MRSIGLAAPRERAEEIRRALRLGECLRSDLRVARLGEEVLFPLLRAPPNLLTGTRIVEYDFAEHPAVRPSSFHDLLDLPPELSDKLPRAFDVVGDIVLIRLPSELRSHAESVGAALLEFVPGARLVGWDRGVHGPERRRQVLRIAGTGGWKTRHRENGLELAVDVEAAYFSPRLAREHAVVAASVKARERVADLCCGVGPFALHIARDARASSIVAVDANPAATALLSESLARLASPVPVEVLNAPLERFLPSAGVSDRVILNLPHEGIKYATSVGAIVVRGGTLHYYEVTERSRAADRPRELEGILGASDGWVASETHVVHPYSPLSDLRAFTFVKGAG